MIRESWAVDLCDFWLGVGCVAWVRVRTECCVLELKVGLVLWVVQRGEGVFEKLSYTICECCV